MPVEDVAGEFLTLLQKGIEAGVTLEEDSGAAVGAHDPVASGGAGGSGAAAPAASSRRRRQGSQEGGRGEEGGGQAGGQWGPGGDS